MTTQGLFYLPRDRPLEADVAIDLSDCPGTAELLQDLGSALAFPDWYGANFDALFDCLSDPDIPGCIRLFGLDAYAHRHPDDFAILVEVLRASCAARAEMEVPLTVCIDITASGAPPLARRMKVYKQPKSVLVIIHTHDLEVLLLERARQPGLWQSVTGSREADEPPAITAQREVLEETGIDCAYHGLDDWHIENSYEIFAAWRERYAPGITHNTEHVFALSLPGRVEVITAPDEHRAHCWLPWQEAAQRCFSWSNRDAILLLGERMRKA